MATERTPDAARYQMYPQLNTAHSLQHMGPQTMQHVLADTYVVASEATDAGGNSSTKNSDDLNMSWRTYPSVPAIDFDINYVGRTGSRQCDILSHGVALSRCRPGPESWDMANWTVGRGQISAVVGPSRPKVSELAKKS
ncbi:uncharacterized protein PG998_014355 [Apiospora kogelbergensis]|uniref:uncharacterized protein n=1 Tax=Apiospora kogelbergensis TaxID=1337665 RepID=UPI00312E2F3E